LAETSEIQTDIQIDVELSKPARVACSKEMMTAMNAILNHISQLEDDIKAYQTEKKAEIAKFEAIIRNDTGEVVKELPLTEDDLQMTLEDAE